jgi:DNA modification methylase
MRNEILQGDVLDTLATLSAESVNCIITSPPYFGLRDYQLPPTNWPEVSYAPMAGLPEITIPAMSCCFGLEDTIEAYVGHMVLVWRGLWRVLRGDGVGWLNLGDSYAGNGKSTGEGEKRSLKTEKFHGGQAHLEQRRIVGNHGIPPKNLIGIPWRVAFALQADGWYLRSDVIWAKCLSGGTVIYAQTQNAEGPMAIKDLVRLDPSTVKLWTGEKWSQVVGWNETPPNPDRKLDTQKRRTHKNRTGEALPLTGELEIHLRSGEKIGCTQDHKFPTQRGLLEAKELKPGDILQSCLLPEPEHPIDPRHLPDTIGWLVGLYLAEGSRSGDTLQIAGHINEVERWARLEKLADDYGDLFRFYPSKDGNGANAHIDGKMLLTIIDTYINGKLAKGKHLAPACWKRSNGFLYQVLQGYLDGDGHFDSDNNRWRLGFTKNDALTQDLRTLAGRLGFSLRLKRTKHTMNGRKFDGWRGQIRFEQSNHHNTKSDNEIVKIEASRARKFWDIAIEDEPHLFALASGVLTHNSNPMPESVTDRPTKAHEYLFLLAKSERYWWDQEAIREPALLASYRSDRPDTTGKTINDTLGDMVRTTPQGRTCGAHPAGRNKRTVWPIATKPFPGAHFAVMPEALVEPCLLAGCPAQCCAECGEPWVRVVERETKSPPNRWGNSPIRYLNSADAGQGQTNLEKSNLGMVTETKTIAHTPTCQHSAPTRPGVVLDPFVGSGTVGVVATKFKRYWLGIELNPDYAKMARQRLDQTQPALFAR